MGMGLVFLAALPQLLFFADDDCSGCQKVQEGIIETAAFQEAVDTVFSFTRYEVSDMDLNDYKELKSRYSVHSIPSLILADGEKKVPLVFLGVKNQTPESFVAYVSAQWQKYEAFKEGLSQLEDKSADELLGLLDLADEFQQKEAVHSVLQRGSALKEPERLLFLAERYSRLQGHGQEAAALAKEIAEKDPHNTLKVQYRLAETDFVFLLSQNAPAEKLIQPLEHYLEKYGANDSQNAWRAKLQIAQTISEDKEKALRYANESLSEAPPLQKEPIAELVEQLTR